MKIIVSTVALLVGIGSGHAALVTDPHVATPPSNVMSADLSSFENVGEATSSDGAYTMATLESLEPSLGNSLVSSSGNQSPHSRAFDLRSINAQENTSENNSDVEPREVPEVSIILPLASLLMLAMMRRRRRSV